MVNWPTGVECPNPFRPEMISDHISFDEDEDNEDNDPEEFSIRHYQTG